MSEKIKLYDTGDCVEVTVWQGCDKEGFFNNAQVVGLVLEAELLEMDGESGLFDPTCEWMYRVALPSGEIAEVWDYEIRPVNVMGKEYNNISRKPEGV
jgi:hypothetical protein